ncbi:hypothetical protein [uncultured Cohaesibacter sp.]|uniref:hypothetical protein n=1 Tax=uncultured Cohaesibacter sp. TaxID=1002546 RepID=UPI0029C81045|nr:hypothetical protein [uncultured Cohaesibacter sp.]
MDIISLVGAFGVGAIVSTFAQSWLNDRAAKRKLAFQEKKEAFVGLLEAYQKAAVEPSDKASKNFAYWQMRCELVSSSQVTEAIQKIIDTNDDIEARYIAHEQLKFAMRLDLGL